MQKGHDRPQEWLDSVAKRETCEWCKHPLKPIYKTRLCRHCYDIRRELKSLHQRVEAAKKRPPPHPRGGPIPVSLELGYKTAIQMAESAQGEGQTYGFLNRRDVTSLDLEHEFRFISKRFLKEDLYNHDAYLFDCFTPSQKRYLLYILSRMSREYLRRKRRRMATWEVISLSIEEVLKNRTHGSFRVEDDS